jgi:hypothetical protein
MKTQLFKTLQVALLVGSLIGFTGSRVMAGDMLRSSQSHPYGEGYGQWAADWWTWALSIPTEINPLTDTNGVYAGVGQHGPVWFLAGASTSGATIAIRDVTLPSGKALFFPIMNTLWTTGPSDPPTTIPDILTTLAGVTADVTNLSCTIDGVPVKHLEKFKTISPVFSLTVPADNVLGLPASVYAPDIDEGYYLFLAPLRAGQHTIHFTGSNPDLGYSLDITYNLIVQKPASHPKRN